MSDRIHPGRASAVALLALCLALAAAVSVSRGTDANWDLQNYHLYSAWAWREGRLFLDAAPAQLQSYFNPLLNLPTFWLHDALGGWPRLVAALMAAPAGVAAFLFALLLHAQARRLAGPGPVALAAAALAAVLGLTGAAFLPGVGRSFHDVTVAVPLLAGLLVALREAQRREGGAPARLGRAALAGLLGGAAAGLKLTMLPFVAGFGLGLLAALGLRAALPAAAAMAAAFAALAGPFAWELWRETGNPVFPMMNHVFASPLWHAAPLADTRFLPRSALQAVFYPFWWLRETTSLVGELPMRDGRVALGFAAAALVALALALGHGRGRWRVEALLLATAGAGYAGWVALFGIHRYLVTLEMLSAMLTLTAALLLLGRRPVLALAALAGLLALALATTTRPDWGAVPFAARAVAVEGAPPPAGALLALTDNDPHAYILPFLPKPAAVLGLNSNFLPFPHDTGLSRRMRARIGTHRGEIWSMGRPGEPPAARDAVLRGFGLAVAGDCRTLRTNIQPGGHLVCPLRRVE